MINTFIKYLLNEKRFSLHTVKSYEIDIKQFEGFLRNNFELPLASAGSRDIRTWIVSLIDTNVHPKSVNRKIASLRSFYKFLLGRELVEENPATKVRPLKTPKPIPEFVQKSEMDDLLDKVEFDHDLVGLRDRLIIELLYGTGMRLSELINLKDSDVDIYNHTIKVLGKRNKERIIPVSKSNLNLIKSYIKERDAELFRENDFLIITGAGKKSYPMMIQRIIKKYLVVISKVHKKSPHVLRHTFATHLLDNGADLNAVKDLLGHANLAATQVYTHNSLEKLKSTFDQAHPKA